MNTKTKTLLVVSLVGLTGLGLVTAASAQDDPETPDVDESTGVYKLLGKRHAGHLARAFAQCDDNITVGECKTEARQAHREAHAARCAEKYDEEFCKELFALKKEQRNETTAYFEEAGYEPQRPPRDADKGEWCQTTYDADFCQGLRELKSEHRNETAELFDEYGYEQPQGKPGPGGHGPPGRGPRGEGPSPA